MLRRAVLLFACVFMISSCGDDAETGAATTVAPTSSSAPTTSSTSTPPTITTTEAATTTEALSVDPAMALIGIWRLHSGYMTFHDDATWTYRVLLAVDPSDNGGYTFEDGVLTFTTEVGSCVGTGEGSYEVAFLSQDEMAWTEVSDECIGRLSLIHEVESIPDRQVQDTIPRHMP